MEEKKPKKLRKKRCKYCKVLIGVDPQTKKLNTHGPCPGNDYF